MSRSVWERIEESRARHNVLEHPLYVRWSAGDLSREQPTRYCGQYRHATEALARLCRETAEAAPERHRYEITAHAAEEESRRLIEEAISPEEADTVIAAAESAFLANWRLLDGVS